MIIVKVDDSFASEVDTARLQLAAQETLDYQGKYSEADLSIVITDYKQVQALNQQFRRVDSSTDVLSFPADFIDPDTLKTYLGDVIISYPICLAQAQSANHPVDQELAILVVHGVLHLMGYDHINTKDKKQMWSLQADILKRLGYKDIKLPD
jgi:probable rRNA maturation factor